MRVIRTRALALALVAGAAASAVPACSCEDGEALQAEQPAIQVDPLEIDFGPVNEGFDDVEAVSIVNNGRVDLHVTATVDPARSSEDFGVSTATKDLSVPAGGTSAVQVTFAPAGAGEDTGVLVLSSNDPDHPQIELQLHGGPIEPRLEVDPDPVDFSGIADTLASREVTLNSTGGARLHVRSIGVDPAGSPDFSIDTTGLTLPLDLKNGESAQLRVVYARSTSAAEGTMIVLSDDAGGEETRVRLVPNALGLCGDGLDNDDDGLVDYPDDPGCEDRDDDSEDNPPECVPGARQPCGNDTGACRVGERLCSERSTWGACEGALAPSAETCDGVDNDCDAETDEGISEACQAGSCQGARACVQDSGVPGGEWTDCLPVGSTGETCDGADEDCDGEIDEGVVEPCTLSGCPGQRICIPGSGGQFTDCQPVDPQPEACNGVDDDCDGSIDENPVPTVCGIGECERQVTGCTNGVPDTCTPGSPGLESCNGLDDDCSGIADDNVPNVQCGLGACQRVAAGCVGGQVPTCTPGVSSPETCNGIDDDCDGTPDNNGACPRCGDGVVQAGETCDDSNNTSGDGCSSTCQSEGCNPDAIWDLSTSIAHSCCEFLGLSQDISSFTFSNNGRRADGSPDGPPTMSGAGTTCPSGAFTFTVTIPGGCDETYTLTGSFSADNTWTGTYTIDFTDNDGSCSCLGLGTPCDDASFNVTATRR